MKIIHARVDDRLIHGQIVVIWSKLIKYDILLVVDDVAASNPMMKSVLKMAAPNGTNPVIVTSEEFRGLLSSPEYASKSAFLIVKSFEMIKKLLECGAEIDAVNLGNLGGKPGAKQLNRSTYLTPTDVSLIRELGARGIRLTNQMVPNDKQTDLLQMVGGF